MTSSEHLLYTYGLRNTSPHEILKDNGIDLQRNTPLRTTRKYGFPARTGLPTVFSINRIYPLPLDSNSVLMLKWDAYFPAESVSNPPADPEKVIEIYKLSLDFAQLTATERIRFMLFHLAQKFI